MTVGPVRPRDLIGFMSALIAAGAALLSSQFSHSTCDGCQSVLADGGRAIGAPASVGLMGVAAMILLIIGTWRGYCWFWPAASIAVGLDVFLVRELTQTYSGQCLICLAFSISLALGVGQVAARSLNSWSGRRTEVACVLIVIAAVAFCVATINARSFARGAALQLGPDAEATAIGPLDSAVVVEAFLSTQCPHCQEFEKVLRRVASDGGVLVIMRYVTPPRCRPHHEAIPGIVEGIEAAQARSGQSPTDAGPMAARARRRVAFDAARGKALGIAAVPTTVVYVRGYSSRRLVGAYGYAEIQGALATIGLRVRD